MINLSELITYDLDCVYIIPPLAGPASASDGLLLTVPPQHSTPIFSCHFTAWFEAKAAMSVPQCRTVFLCPSQVLLEPRASWKPFVYAGCIRGLHMCRARAARTPYGVRLCLLSLLSSVLFHGLGAED